MATTVGVGPGGCSVVLETVAVVGAAGPLGIAFGAGRNGEPSGPAGVTPVVDASGGMNGATPAGPPALGVPIALAA
jgi:hypothetical protein